MYGILLQQPKLTERIFSNSQLAERQKLTHCIVIGLCPLFGDGKM